MRTPLVNLGKRVTSTDFSVCIDLHWVVCLRSVVKIREDRMRRAYFDNLRSLYGNIGMNNPMFD